MNDPYTDWRVQLLAREPISLRPDAPRSDRQTWNGLERRYKPAVRPGASWRDVAMYGTLTLLMSGILGLGMYLLLDFLSRPLLRLFGA